MRVSRDCRRCRTPGSFSSIGRTNRTVVGLSASRTSRRRKRIVALTALASGTGDAYACGCAVVPCAAFCSGGISGGIADRRPLASRSAWRRGEVRRQDRLF